VTASCRWITTVPEQPDIDKPDMAPPFDLVRMHSPDVALAPPLSDELDLLLELAGAANERPLLLVKLKRNGLGLAALTHGDGEQARGGGSGCDDGP